MTTEEPSNIVGINPEVSAEIEIQLQKRTENKFPCCGVHKAILVDSELRSVHCSKCGFVLDPFEYLAQWAKEGDHRMAALKTLDIKIRIANAELDDRGRQINNMRATLKRGGSPQSSENRRHYEHQRWNPHLISVIHPDNPKTK